MKKLLFVTLISLLLLSACSSQQKYSSVNEAIKSLENNITQIQSPEDKIDGIPSVSYKLNNDEIIRVYDFGSEEKRDIGKEHFEESISLLSSHAPIVYQSGKYLVLYYSQVDSNTRTPKLNETMCGEKIEKALNSL